MDQRPWRFHGNGFQIWYRNAKFKQWVDVERKTTSLTTWMLFMPIQSNIHFQNPDTVTVKSMVGHVELADIMARPTDYPPSAPLEKLAFLHRPRRLRGSTVHLSHSQRVSHPSPQVGMGNCMRTTYERESVEAICSDGAERRLNGSMSALKSLLEERSEQCETHVPRQCLSDDL